MMDRIPADFYRRRDGLTKERYQALYRQSRQDPAAFWGEQAAIVDFYQPWQQVMAGEFDQGQTRWFVGATVNACYNCVDRHLADHADDIAILWQGDEPDQATRLSYRQLHEQVCRLANVLMAHGIAKGDRVGIYLPMIPEAVVAMLACARIGAVHCVVFGGFSAEALQDRFQNIACRLVITADQGKRGGKVVPLKSQVDTALRQCPLVETVVVIRHGAEADNHLPGRDIDYHAAVAQAEAWCACVEVEANDPLFILHTSGSTGKPKGILHGTAGYLVYTALSFKILFDHQAGDVYWCTADVGWVTGHSYNVYGPLANRATILLFEGVPSYPDPSRYWRIIDQYRVAIFYTAPTAIRALMREGDEWLVQSSRDSLRILGSVGEPINPLVWQWYFDKVGKGRCPIVDTWWQTETGGILIAPIVGISPLKPGSAGRPFWGVDPLLLDEHDRCLTGAASGRLVLGQSWPSLMQTVYGDHQRFIDSYLREAPGYYVSGDGAKRDEDGDYWLTGRLDDVLNCSGHRIGTAEVESALVAHSDIAEAAVVGYPHPIKGEGIYAFVTAKKAVQTSETLKQALLQQVVKAIGPIAKPDVIHFAEALPKTRSGKIMRRLLKQIAAGSNDFGDITTLTDPSVIDKLMANKP